MCLACTGAHERCQSQSDTRAPSLTIFALLLVFPRIPLKQAFVSPICFRTHTFDAISAYVHERAHAQSHFVLVDCTARRQAHERRNYHCVVFCSCPSVRAFPSRRQARMSIKVQSRWRTFRAMRALTLTKTKVKSDQPVSHRNARMNVPYTAFFHKHHVLA